LNKYTILTIGDGLVGQIPSLLISLATGILVTKGSKTSDFGQILDQTAVWRSESSLFCWSYPCRTWNSNTAPNYQYCLAYGCYLYDRWTCDRQGTIETEKVEKEVSTEEQAAEEVRQPENVNKSPSGRSD
jgi:flagellar biosynthesis protein FlhA